MLPKYLTLSAAIAVCLFANCSKPAEPKVAETPAPSLELGSPVETLAPNTNYKPAFAGQTRIGSIKTKTPIQYKVLSTALANPWGIAPLPDARFLITEKAGNMRIATSEGVLSSAISGLPAVNASGQGGMLGLLVDPNFGSNRMVYWAYSENATGGTLTAIAKGRLSTDEKAMENVSVIYRANSAHNSSLHFGARLVMDVTGNLLICLGERSNLSTRVLAQSVSSSWGKVIRITTTGSPAPGNPIFEGVDALPELFSMGHRNPQGLAIHPSSGEVWLSEFGPRGGDEVNRLQAGKNYGWPTITYGIEYGGQTIGAGIQQKDGMEQPVYYWDPVVSPSGMTFYKGNRVPEWQNNLFIGALSATHIIRLHIGNNTVMGEERLLASEGQRFRDICQGTDGALYAITDAGRLYKIDKE
ncbi:MAG: PQQ-dependent sugar dehydrogenase [Bacteroidota bacterium]|nr:PQQ-dependent sugar dehydrogenase [Bacteroidota bacterium]